MPKEFSIIRVWWIDSGTADGWRCLSEFETPTAIICETVGFLVRRNKIAFVIAATMGDPAEDDPYISGIIEIPVVAIRKWRQLG